MTEAEWLACGEPFELSNELLRAPREVMSFRRRQLFGVACCRRAWHLLWGPARDLVDGCEVRRPGQDLSPLRAYRAAVAEAPEADRTPSPARLANHAVTHLLPGRHGHPPDNVALALAGERAGVLVPEPGDPAATPAWSAEYAAERAVQADLFRDIFGNPFRPATLDRSWLTPTVVSPAEGIYAERAFDRLPILADALQDAGCDHADILTHLRGGGPHVRGCWAPDLILGKT